MNFIKKYFIYIIVTLIILAIILIIYFKNTNTEINNTNYISGTKLSTNITNNQYNSTNPNTINNQSKEHEIAAFSTEIKDDSEGRLANIDITCSTIDNTILNPGDTFSFNEIVGQPTSEKGYQEATVIIDGEHEKGIGGGNCQVSSTLYNAVLDVPYLTIIERNEHGLPVTYVPKGQDAAVSYGSLDLKFRNDGDKKIKIKMTSDGKSITSKIIEL